MTVDNYQETLVRATLAEGTFVHEMGKLYFIITTNAQMTWSENADYSQNGTRGGKKSYVSDISIIIRETYIKDLVSILRYNNYIAVGIPCVLWRKFWIEIFWMVHLSGNGFILCSKTRLRKSDVFPNIRHFVNNKKIVSIFFTYNRVNINKRRRIALLYRKPCRYRILIIQRCEVKAKRDSAGRYACRFG